MIFKKKLDLILLLALLVHIFSTSTTAFAQQQKIGSSNLIAVTAEQKTIAAKIIQFLEQSKRSYTKVSDAVWTTPFKGKSFGDFDVTVITIPETDLLTMFVVVAEKKNLRLSQDILYKLLRYNISADQVKIGIDNDGNLLVRADVNARIMDLKEFNDMLDQVAAATDEVHEQIKGSLLTTR
ncbi:hypothetical protein [Nostoc sp. 106C]|uniref:hypothetical protein n=1 Tax=Nostoc sp. 106C TaxID=1932667 RepID=UPI000A38A4B3|nr:hypothetical protein [Nostoc sp. 106C]OUL18003.1 hypothetical protein BV375_34895 [Nostoc sp. 106C]